MGVWEGHIKSWAEIWRRVWGRRKKFRGRTNISKDPCNQKFPLYIYDPFLDETKIPPLYLFSQFVLCHASNNTTLRNIWGDGCMRRPPSQIFGGPSLQSPLSLRPCIKSYPALQS